MVDRILGVHEAKPSGHRFPGATWGREFVSDKGRPLPESTSAATLIKKVTQVIAPHHAADGGCMVSIKLPLGSVAKGRWDARLEELGAHLSGSSRLAATEVILNHEPENDSLPGVFVPGFNRGRGALKRAAPDLVVNYAAMAYAWRPGAKETRDPRAWSEDLRADRYLADVYFGKSFSQSYTLATHPGLQRFLQHMIDPHPGRRMGLAEYGRLAHAARADMFAEDFNLLAGPLASLSEVVLAWNTGGTEGNAGWMLDEPAQKAIRAGFNRLNGAPSAGPGDPWVSVSMSMSAELVEQLRHWSEPVRVRVVQTPQASGQMGYELEVRDA